MHVLVVDDDPSIRTLLSSALSSRGHTVESLSGGFSVGSRLLSSTEQSVDVIVLDVMMPGLSGNSVVKQLATSTVGRETRIVLYSAMPAEAVLPDAQNVHPNVVFVQKGARVLEIIRAVEG